MNQLKSLAAAWVAVAALAGAGTAQAAICATFVSASAAGASSTADVTDNGGNSDACRTFSSTQGETPELVFAMHASNTSGASLFARDVVVTPAPESESYALMFAGLTCIGFIARRRRPA